MVPSPNNRPNDSQSNRSAESPFVSQRDLIPTNDPYLLAAAALVMVAVPLFTVLFLAAPELIAMGFVALLVVLAALFYVRGRRVDPQGDFESEHRRR